jgi:hypothetical protein
VEILELIYDLVVGYVEVGCDFGDLGREWSPQDHFQPRLIIFFLGLGWVGLGPKDFHR